MKSLNKYITEKLKVSKKQYIYKPNNKHELSNIIVEHFNNNNTDLTDIDVSLVTDLSLLFTVYDLTQSIKKNNIESFDVSNWDISNCDSIYNIFDGLETIKYIYGLETWDVSNVGDFSEIFFSCKSLKEVNLSNWNIKNMFTCYSMFENCYELENIIGIENWKIPSKLKDVKFLFCNCKSLKNINLSNWDVSNIEKFNSMFKNCISLELVDLNNWDTKNNKDMSFMFCNCKNLKNVIGFNKFDMKLCSNTEYMFNDCVNLETLGDVSNLNMSNILILDNMFFNCKKLNMDCYNWKLNKYATTFNMFYNTSDKIKKCKIK